jgi:hypothetical protein
VQQLPDVSGNAFEALTVEIQEVQSVQMRSRVVGRNGGSSTNHEGRYFDGGALGLPRDRKPKSQTDLGLAGQREAGMDAGAAGTQVMEQDGSPFLGSTALQLGRKADDRSWMQPSLLDHGTQL